MFIVFLMSKKLLLALLFRCANLMIVLIMSNRY